MWLELGSLIILIILWPAIKIVVYGMAAAKFLFLTVKEGEIVLVMNGDDVRKSILNMQEHHLATKIEIAEGSGKVKRGDVLPDVPGKEYPVELITRFCPGVYWKGLPIVSKVYGDKFYWIKLDKDGKPQVRDEIVYSAYAKNYQYVMPLKDAETRAMVRVSFLLLVVIRVTNAETAWLHNDKWLALVTADVLARAKDFVAACTDPDEIIKLGATTPEGRSDLGDSIRKKLETEEMLKNIKEKQGVEIVTINVTDVEYGDWAALAISKITAEKQGDAAIATAQKEAEALGYRTEAEVKYYGSVINELGPDFYIALKRIEQLTAASKVGTNILVDIGSVREFLSTSALRSGVDPSDAQKLLALAAQNKGIKIPTDVIEQNETAVSDIIEPVKADVAEITPEERQKRRFKKLQGEK